MIHLSMISRASDVASYLAEVPTDRCCKRGGAIEVSFASQKQYIALYILKKEVLVEFRSILLASSIGKGCIRFKKPDTIHFKIVQKLLEHNVESPAGPC